MITFELMPSPSTRIDDRSPAPTSVPRSEGFIGEAFTSISTSSAPGFGISMSRKAISNVASSLIVDVS